MRMTRLSSNHQRQNHKPSKETEEELQNELNFQLAENTLTKLPDKQLISQEEFNRINKLNR